MKYLHLSGSSWDSDMESTALRTEEVVTVPLLGLWLPENQRICEPALNWCTARGHPTLGAQDDYLQKNPDTGLRNLKGKRPSFDNTTHPKTQTLPRTQNSLTQSTRGNDHSRDPREVTREDV